MGDYFCPRCDQRLGEWVKIDRAEYLSIIENAGGIEQLKPFATFTDPDQEIYTAWGREDEDAPLVDCREIRWTDPPESHFRKFVTA
jgi:hypothetical protein